MDKFEKATTLYVLIFAAAAVLRTYYPIATLGFILTHLVYLKFALDDIVEKNSSRLWLPGFGIIGILAALPYIYVRRGS